MAEKVLMLALSPTMESGVISKWIKHEGDTIAEGDVLCEVETDKAVMDYESAYKGTLLKIVLKDGDHAAVGELMAVVGKPGEDIASVLAGNGTVDKKPDQATTKQPDAPVEKPTEGATSTADAGAQVAEQNAGQDSSSVGHIKSSPLARKLAEVKGIPLGNIIGSGPAGRVVKRDVEAAAATVGSGVKTVPPAKTVVLQPTGLDESIPVSGKRKIIAARLAESMYTAPHYYLKLSVRMDALLAARKQLASGGEKLSLNAFLMKFIGRALQKHPEINATWQGDTILRHGSVDIGLAVAQPDGLITPVVRDCSGKGIKQIDSELAVLVDKALKGGLKPEDYSGATFTISNLGSFGIEEFTAIINPPGSAILAVGKIMKQQVVEDDDTVHIVSLMKLTLSCDHRVIDGAVGARFLKDLADMIENPILALL